MSTNLNIEVRGYDAFSVQERLLIEKARLNSDNFEAWTAQGTNAQLSYSTHGIFRYFGKFPPTIARKLIADYTCESDVVYDLTSGSGTTGVECALLGRRCLLNDVNPLSELLARVKTTKLEEKKITDYLTSIKENYRPLSGEEFDAGVVGIKDIDHWFLPETIDSLRGIKKLVTEIPEEKYRDFFTVCFVAIIRNVSKATTQQGRLFLDVLSAKKDAFESFEKKVKASVTGVCSLPSETQIEIVCRNILTPLPTETNAVAKLTVLHPPYFNSYKYSSVNSLELAWLGIDHATVRKNEIKEFFKVGQAQNVQTYVQDMSKAVSCAYETLKSDGRMAIMIGDTVIKNEYVPVTSLLTEQIDKLLPSLQLEKTILRVPKYTEASWVASQRRRRNDIGVNLCDFILIYRKTLR